MVGALQQQLEQLHQLGSEVGGGPELGHQNVPEAFAAWIEAGGIEVEQAVIDELERMLDVLASVKARHNEVVAIALTPQQRQAITKACRRHRVARLHAFGSVVGSDYQPGVSDIDLLVEFEPCDAGALYKAYFSLLNELRLQLPAQVDLVMADAVRNPYIKASIEADKQMLYAA